MRRPPARRRLTTRPSRALPMAGHARSADGPTAILSASQDVCSAPSSFPKTDGRYWEQRLVHSGYGKLARPQKFAELSARVEHDGTSYIFPLQSGVTETAAVRALEIYRTAVSKGWPTALSLYPREFTFAIFWAENPMIFTYTTLYTVAGDRSDIEQQRPSSIRRDQVKMAIVEGDEGCRRALADWIAGIPPYACQGLYRTGAEALAALRRQPADFVLFNRHLSDLAAGEFAKSLQHAAPGARAFGYRIYSCSDDLFVSQPGMSGGYYFRRRPPKDLLEPIGGSGPKRPLNPSEWDACIYRYVCEVFRRPLLHHAAQGPSSLTPREHDILNYLCQGSSDKEIAHALNISSWTVHTHLKKVYEKLGVHSRTEAVINYLQK